MVSIAQGGTYTRTVAADGRDVLREVDRLTIRYDTNGTRVALNSPRPRSTYRVIRVPGADEWTEGVPALNGAPFGSEVVVERRVAPVYEYPVVQHEVQVEQVLRSDGQVVAGGTLTIETRDMDADKEAPGVNPTPGERRLLVGMRTSDGLYSVGGFILDGSVVRWSHRSRPPVGIPDLVTPDDFIRRVRTIVTPWYRRLPWD